MDERGVVEELDAGGEADRLVAHDTEGLARMQGQPGAHSLAPGFEVIASSEGGIPAALRDTARRAWGLQFHPEVSHCEGGMRILENFVVGICGAARQWSMEAYLDEVASRLKALGTQDGGDRA